jgi:glycosyltransferase involved in cell wall biosynthesis
VRKRIYLRLYSILRLHRRVIWHASTPRERQDIARVIGLSASILVREDETHLPDRAEPPPTEPTEALSLVFLSRISEKKGLHTLLEALEHTREPVALRVFGFVEDPQYFARCEALAQRLPPHVSYAYCGSVEPGDVRDTFASSDVFVFPTAGENFGHVIAESLSVSCPVMCADTTPWTPYIEARGGGVLVSSLDPTTWATAIDRYAGLSAEERLQRRKSAGDAFDDWRREDKGEHIFDLVRPFVT